MLQDVHWAVGSFGYFPSYALGAVIAAQFYEAIRDAVPDIDAQIARGEFAGLMGWLQQNVHGQGARVSTQELLKIVHRQTAVRGHRAALPRIEVSRARIARRQRGRMTRGVRRVTIGGWLLAGVSAVLAIAAFVVPAMPQPLSYHAFADCRTIFGLPNFFNVVSNLPFLVAGVLGLVHVYRGDGRFIDPREQLPYLVFFLGALLTCFGSAYYHAAPDNARLVWDRLPMTLGFAGLVAAAVAERVDLKLGLRVVMAAAGPGRRQRHLLARDRKGGRWQRHSRTACTRPGPSWSSCW